MADDNKFKPRGQVQPVTAPTVRVDEDSNSAVEAAPEVSLRDRIKAKRETRAFNPKFLDGKGMLFNLDNYEQDYRAGGQLAGRFVLNNPSRVSMMRKQGYMFPNEWDSSLPKQEFGGLTLMLSEAEHASYRRKVIEQLSAAQETVQHKVPQLDKSWKEGGAQGAIALEGVEKAQSTYVGKTPGRKGEVIGPD